VRQPLALRGFEGNVRSPEVQCSVSASLLPVFERLFDDAGLFPPASRPMAEALRAHERARTGPYRRLVGPFLCPVDRIDELDACVAAGVPRPPELAVIGVRGSPAWRRITYRPGVVQVEAPLGVPLPEGAQRVACYLELPPDGPVDELVAQVAASGAGAKVRCGGVTPDAVPPPERLAEVLVACAKQRLPLKATAGLHHPFRRRAAAGGGGQPQHGFVNLLAAASVAHTGAGCDEVARILDTEDDDRERSLLIRIDRRSRTLLRSIGSCSIDEPAEGLAALDIL
jgi:hypothetical protein